MKGWTAFGLSVACAGLAAASFVGTSCSPKNEAYEGPEGGVGTTTTNDAGVTYCGTAGTACCAAAGQTPFPECDNGDETQCTGSTTCDLSKCQAVNTTKGGCEALTTNPTSGPLGFRMSRIILVAPTNLATETAQNTVVNSGVDMTDVACGAPKGGPQTGDFSWILSLDTTAQTITTGGAPPCNLTDTPACDPFTTGYCFVHKQVGQFAVAPVTAPVIQDNAGLYYALNIGKINVPIYFQGSIIVLPINGGSMAGVKVSPDGNCIGTFDPDALYSDCGNDYTACSLWNTAGSITGYITLEQADSVQVKLLSATLCAFLTNTPKAAGASIAVCPRDGSGKITAKGDYCSSPQAPGGCQDSFWLAATFAASAVKINDGTTSGPNGGPNPDCLGGTSSGDDDAGTDANAGGDDAGNDAGSDASDAAPE